MMATKNETLVIGASLKPNRYSNIAITRLRNNEQTTKAIGLREGEVEDVKIETKLKDFQNIDTVTLYLNPKRQRDYYEYIISLNPRRVIFNPGTENPDFYKMLRENKIQVEVACTLVLLSTNQY